MPCADSTAPIESVSVSTYTVPTDRPESDGTLEWDATTLVLVRIRAGGREGIGYGYADTATGRLIADKLAHLLQGTDALAISARWCDMAVAIRNLGRPGICAMAMATVDAALWDLKGKCLGLSLAVLLGKARTSIALYGSGGFTSYTVAELQAQLGGWAAQAFRRVKMKVGRHPDEDVGRVFAARQAIGADVELFVDANGAYTRKQALLQARRFSEMGVCWFEEPVSSDDLAGLRLLREQGPPGMAIAAGEYGYDAPYFCRMLEAQAVDVIQADATRCGVTGFLVVAGLAEAFGIPLSAHCAPSLHVALCCAARPAVHLEYFHDHARIENLLFEGTPQPREGRLAPVDDRPGLGLDFREKDAECYKN